MKSRLTFILVLQLFLLQHLQAQKLILKLDEKEILPNTVVEYYPNYYQWQVMEGDKRYVILKGTATLMNKGKTIATKSIAHLSGAHDLFDKALLPGAYLQVEAQQIGDPATKEVRAAAHKVALQFSKELKARPNPRCMLLINNSTDYFNQGVNPQQVEHISFKAMEEYGFEKMNIYHVRGVRPIKFMAYTDLQSAAEGLKEMLKDASVQVEDRFVVEFQGRSTIAVNVPIVE